MPKTTTGRAVRGSKPPVKAFFAALNPDRPDVAKASLALLKEEMKSWLAENREIAKPAVKRGRGRPKGSTKRAGVYARRLNGSRGSETLVEA